MAKVKVKVFPYTMSFIGIQRKDYFRIWLKRLQLLNSIDRMNLKCGKGELAV